MRNCAFLAPFYVAGYVGSVNDADIPDWQLCLASREEWLARKLAVDPSFMIENPYTLRDGWMLATIEDTWQTLNLTPSGVVTSVDRWGRGILITKDHFNILAVNSSPDRLTGGVTMAFVARKESSMTAFLQSFSLEGALETKTEADYWR